VTGTPRPAFYSLEAGGWRDYITLLHLPYTAWHLSYVVIGACLAPIASWPHLGLTVLAFLLAMGIGAHALDERNGRPLRTEIPSGVLVALAVVSVAVACGIGLVVALDVTLWLIAVIALGAFLVPAYSLELLGGVLHNNLGFALSWGAFPVVTGYLAQTGTIRVETLLGAAAATVLSLGQRSLSTSVRRIRREIVSVQGDLVDGSGLRTPLTSDDLLRAPERALRLMCAAVVLLAAALTAGRA
jgi:hypothetical protein